MRGRTQFIGSYIPGTSRVHAAPLWIKACALLALGILTIIFQGWIPRTVLLAMALGLYLFAGLPLKMLWSPIRMMWFFLVIIIAYQTWTNGPATAWALVAGILACVYASNLLITTTETQVLLDGVVRAASPLEPFGADPERFALTISIMLRSIPFIVGAFDDVRDAAMARGLERNPRARILPVAVATVAYARQTGSALAARGIGDRADGVPSTAGSTARN